MRHGKKINHLSRTAPHRKALLANMSISLIESKRITTTVAKAKALKKQIEPLITKAKSDTTHSRRVVFSYLQDKDAVSTLFGEIATKIGDRPGGYTRIIKTGNRLGDNADMCVMELVDFNELLIKEDKPATKAKRSRRGAAKKKAGDAVASDRKEVKAEATPKAESAEVEAPKVEEKSEEKEVEAKAETDVKDEAKAEEPKKEEDASDDKKKDE